MALIRNRLAFFLYCFFLNRVFTQKVKIFRAPSTILPWSTLTTLRPAPYGVCWILINSCFQDADLVGLIDDSDKAYRFLKVGEIEQACLSRAEYYWNICGNGAHQPVVVRFLHTGASNIYPPDSVLEEARERMDHLFTKYNYMYSPDLTKVTAISTNIGTSVLTHWDLFSCQPSEIEDVSTRFIIPVQMSWEEAQEVRPHPRGRPVPI